LSCNKVEAKDVCAQDLLNAQSVNAPVTGSLRVQQPCGDKDKGKRSQTEAVNGVRINNNWTRDIKWEINVKSKSMRGAKPGVRARGRTTKLKPSTNCCVSLQSQ